MFIKGFDKDLKCRGYQFEIGEVYDTGYTENLSCCSKTVFHFCKSLGNIHKYYDVIKDNRFCEIEVLGELIKDDDKYGSNKIKIVREIVGDELRQLKMLTNGNTGVFNTGNYNTGNYNTGNYNTGNYNTGYRNAGYYNTGDYNTGYFNSVDFETGFFNTKESTVRIFNKKSNLKPFDFYNKYWGLFCGFTLIRWVAYTDKEKENSVIRQCLGGYLKEYTFEEASLNWYQKLKTYQKKLLFTIPNFDCEIFEKITGLDVRKDFESYGPNTN